jgi:hypothetical protein
VRAHRLLWTFAVFHATLGIVVFVASLTTLLRALGWMGGAAPHLHYLALLAGVETIAALLFLVPATFRFGGGLLLGTFALAIGVHLLRVEFPASLLVYAAGTVLVLVHGEVFTAVGRSVEAPRRVEEDR